jgi:hypothetical protein
MEGTDRCHRDDLFQYGFESQATESIRLNNCYFRFVVHSFLLFG